MIGFRKGAAAAQYGRKQACKKNILNPCGPDRNAEGKLLDFVPRQTGNKKFDGGDAA